ncbi:hypothetical protein G5B35_02525 [Parapusillimonas sp. SGNA-6]|nr:hypothetical protein [Parapusillimonas sp. SGNA-6]
MRVSVVGPASPRRHPVAPRQAVICELIASLRRRHVSVEALAGGPGVSRCVAAVVSITQRKGRPPTLHAESLQNACKTR